MCYEPRKQSKQEMNVVIVDKAKDATRCVKLVIISCALNVTIISKLNYNFIKVSIRFMEFMVFLGNLVMARKGGLFDILGLPYVGLYQVFRLTKREFFPPFSRKIHR